MNFGILRFCAIVSSTVAPETKIKQKDECKVEQRGEPLGEDLSLDFESVQNARAFRSEYFPCLLIKLRGMLMNIPLNYEAMSTHS